MESKKGLANSAAALATSTALAAGLMLLSFSGNPYSLAGQTAQQSGANATGDNLDFPGNRSLNASDVPRNALSNTSIPQNQDLVTTVAKSLFKFLSGKNIEPPQGQLQPNISENMTGNQTLPENMTDPDSNTTENITEPDRPNITEPDPENISEPNITEPPINQTPDINQTSLNGTKESLGFAAKLIKSLKGLFSGEQDLPQNNQTPSQNQTQPENQTEPPSEPPQENSTDPEPPEDNETSQTPEEGNNTQQSDDKDQQKQGLPDINLKNLLPILGLLAAAALALLFYRSDKDGKEFLKAVFNKVRNFVYSVPDLFRRTIVNSISFIYSKTNALYILAVRIAKAPAKTLRSIKNRIIQKIQYYRGRMNRVRQRSVKQNLEVLLKGQQETFEGLDEVWHELKTRSKLKGETTVTPAEVRAEAVKQNLPEETVDQVVDAFRHEKYTVEGCPDMLNISEWEGDLRGDSDE